MTRVKICGLCRAEDVELAVACGADAVGFVLEPSSPRCLSLAEAERLAAVAGPYCTSVAVYGRARGPFPRVGAVQAVAFDEVPTQPRVLALRLRPGERVASESLNGYAAVVLDAYAPDQYGGTGKRIDWGVAAELVESLPVPVVLAGGLTPDNVAEAVRLVRPYAVDVSSGVESEPRVKDAGKLRAFVQAAKG